MRCGARGMRRSPRGAEDSPEGMRYWVKFAWYKGVLAVRSLDPGWRSPRGRQDFGGAVERAGWGTGGSSGFLPDSLAETGPRRWGMGLGMERRSFAARGMRLAERFGRAECSLTTESKENPGGLTGLPRLGAGSPVFFTLRAYFAGSNFRE